MFWSPARIALVLVGFGFGLAAFGGIMPSIVAALASVGLHIGGPVGYAHFALAAWALLVAFLDGHEHAANRTAVAVALVSLLAAGIMPALDASRGFGAADAWLALAVSALLLVAWWASRPSPAQRLRRKAI